MTQSPNQFVQTVEKGMLSLNRNYNTIPVKIDDSETGTLVPGQPVKLIDNAGKSILVVKAAADTDDIFGYIPYTRGKNEFLKNESFEIASQGNVLYLEASAAIARGAKVMPVIADHKIATATAGKSVIGIALDKAAADGDLIRVFLLNLNNEKLA